MRRGAAATTLVRSHGAPRRRRCSGDDGSSDKRSPAEHLRHRDIGTRPELTRKGHVQELALWTSKKHDVGSTTSVMPFGGLASSERRGLSGSSAPTYCAPRCSWTQDLADIGYLDGTRLADRSTIC